MKLQDQVCMLEQAKRLKELGVKQESLFYFNRKFDTPVIRDKIIATTPKIKMVFNDKQSISAFTVAELGAMIGKGTNAAALFYDAVQARMNQSHSFTIALDVKFVANCVIGLLETGILTPEEVNARLCS